MSAYPPVDLPICEPGGPDGPEVLQTIHEWVYSRPLADLVRHFGGALPPPTELPKALDYLDEFSESAWDFRRGRERYQSEQREFPRDTERLVRQAAGALGLFDREQPRGTTYSHLLVLGGRVRTCLVRADFAARLLRAGVVTGQVAGLASLRPCDPEESEHATLLGLAGCTTEFDGMAAGLRSAFAVADEYEQRSGDEDSDPRAGWRVASYRAEPAVHVVAAPSSQPRRRRANTADTLTFWADTVGNLTSRDRVLLVTSSLHVPFQHCDAIRVLGIRYGCGIDTVGVNGETVSDSRLRVQHRTTTVLQEVRSAIRSMRQLRTGLLTQVRPS